MLRAQGLNSFYGKSHILHDVSLTVQPGEVVSLLGRNGAGKTTTFKTLMGLITPRSGRVELEVDGATRDLTFLKPYDRAVLGLGYVPEDRRIFANLTVFENIRVGLDRVTRDPAERAARIERVFELYPVLREKRNDPGRSLSGGQQRMLAIARALVLNPKVLLLDEPSQGLAPVILDQLLDSVRALADSGIGVLIAEQNAFAALDISDRAYMLEKGVVTYEGTASDLKAEKTTLNRFLGVGTG